MSGGPSDNKCTFWELPQNNDYNAAQSLRVESHDCPKDQRCERCTQREALDSYSRTPLGLSSILRLSDELKHIKERTIRPPILLLLPDICLPYHLRHMFYTDRHGQERADPRHFAPLFENLSDSIRGYHTRPMTYVLSMDKDIHVPAAQHEQIVKSDLVICIICPPPIVSVQEESREAIRQSIAHYWKDAMVAQLHFAVVANNIRRINRKSPVVVVGLADAMGNALWPKPDEIRRIGFHYFLTFTCLTERTLTKIAELLVHPDKLEEYAERFGERDVPWPSYRSLEWS